VKYREKLTYEYLGGECVGTVDDCSQSSLIRAAGGVCTSRDVEACNGGSEVSGWYAGSMDVVAPYPPCSSNEGEDTDNVAATNSDGDDTCTGYRPCPIDCVWSAFSSWSDCSAECGQDGVQYRTRYVVVEPEPSIYYGGSGGTTQYDCETSVIYGDSGYVGSNSKLSDGYPCGAPCMGNHTEYRQCFRKECPVDCEWSPWSSWSSCSKLCGGGSQMRSRYVKVQPQHGGLLCEPTVCESDTGHMKGRCGATETRTCNPMSCEYQRIRQYQDDASVPEDLCQFKDLDSIYCPINETRTGGPLTAVGADPRPNDPWKVDCTEEAAIPGGTCDTSSLDPVGVQAQVIDY
jgi:hypothetical protein